MLPLAKAFLRDYLRSEFIVSLFLPGRYKALLLAEHTNIVKMLFAMESMRVFQYR